MGVSRRLLAGEAIATVITPVNVEEATERERSEAAEAAGRELAEYAATLPGILDRAVLYRSLLHLQRRFFLLANQMTFAELESLYDAYKIAYRELEDALYTLDMLPPEPIGGVREEAEEDAIELAMAWENDNATPHP